MCSEASTGWQHCTTEHQASPPLDALLPFLQTRGDLTLPTWLSPGPTLMALLGLRVVTLCVRTPGTPGASLCTPP